MDQLGKFIKILSQLEETLSSTGRSIIFITIDGNFEPALYPNKPQGAGELTLALPRLFQRIQNAFDP